MNKKYFLLFLLSPFIFGQVGVNTDDPQATMEIKATNPTGGSTSKDGLIIPNITRQRAQNMDNPSESTLIYISEATSGSASGKAIDIDEKGYYYYNGTKWVKLITWDNINGPTHTFTNAIAHDQTTNLVKLGGNLTEPTTITTDNVNTFALVGLQNGTITDNLVVIDPITGILKKISIDDIEICKRGDLDNDGICDDWDRQLDTPAGTRIDGAGVAFDTDLDGVIDLYDRCVTIPGPASNNGCPVSS